MAFCSFSLALEYLDFTFSHTATAARCSFELIRLRTTMTPATATATAAIAATMAIIFRLSADGPFGAAGMVFSGSCSGSSAASSSRSVMPSEVSKARVASASCSSVEETRGSKVAVSSASAGATASSKSMVSSGILGISAIVGAVETGCSICAGTEEAMVRGSASEASSAPSASSESVGCNLGKVSGGISQLVSTTSRDMLDRIPFIDWESSFSVAIHPSFREEGKRQILFFLPFARWLLRGAPSS